MYEYGHGVTPSWRRAREYYERAIELGSSTAVENMQDLTASIQNVRSRRSNHSTRPLLVRDLTLLSPRSLLPSHSQCAPLMDKRVELHGTRRADMNGKRGVATDFHYYEDEGKWRYTVKLDGGEAFKVNPANLRAKGAGGAGRGDGGGGGAGVGTDTAKGKKGGKKARAGSNAMQYMYMHESAARGGSGERDGRRRRADQEGHNEDHGSEAEGEKRQQRAYWYAWLSCVM